MRRRSHCRHPSLNCVLAFTNFYFIAFNASATPKVINRMIYAHTQGDYLLYLAYVCVRSCQFYLYCYECDEIAEKCRLIQSSSLCVCRQSKEKRREKTSNNKQLKFFPSSSFTLHVCCYYYYYYYVCHKMKTKKKTDLPCTAACTIETNCV